MSVTVKGKIVKIREHEYGKTSLTLELDDYQTLDLSYEAGTMSTRPTHQQWVEVEYYEPEMTVRDLRPLQESTVEEITRERKVQSKKYMRITSSIALIAGILMYLAYIIMWESPIIALYFYIAGGIVGIVAGVTRKRNI